MPKCIDCENFRLTRELSVICKAGQRLVFVSPRDEGPCADFSPKPQSLDGTIVFDCVRPPNIEADGINKVSKSNYMTLSNAYDEHSRCLMEEKGEEYSVDDDFLCMENRLAGMTGRSPEHVSLVMAGKHITALTIILDKNKPEEINLAKLDERVRDACNLLKIMAAFIHAKQDDFTLHLK